MADVLAFGQRIISMAIDIAQVLFTVWMATGGITFVLRALSFNIDILLVNFIGKIYTYFMLLLKGEMFNKEVTSAVMQNIYLFIGVIVFFRLMMVLLKYIMNPEMVNDGKVGASSLVKRVIIGMAGIVLIPTIFTTATEFQASIIEDQLIQKIIMPKDLIDATANKVNDGGKFIGTYVFAGFINPSSTASENIQKEYKVALSKGDLSVIDYNHGGFLGIGWTSYSYSYFFLLSTFVLGYVLYLMLKYCLDIVVRFFKLFLYQLLAPIAMIEYMINGSDNGVFKNWRTATLGTYFMLFVRVLAIWFVVFVMSLMSGEMPGYTNGSLLSNPDYLLRALIIIGLLAFMMDLPKLVGQVFGIDLEQESSATGLLKTVTGGLKSIASVGAGFAGAMVGGAVGAAKGGLGSIANNMANKNANKAKNAVDPAKKAAAEHRAQAWSNLSHGKSIGTTSRDALKASRKGMTGALINSNAITKSAYSGYAAVGESVKGKEQQREEAARYQDEANFRNDVRRGLSTISNDDLAKQARNSLPKNATEEEVLTATANSKLMATAQANGFITTSGVTSTIDGAKGQVQAEINGTLNSGMSASAVAEITYKDMGSKLGVSEQVVKQIVQTEYASRSDNATKSQNIIDKVYAAAVETSKEEVAPSVRKEYGQRTMSNVEATGDRIVDSVAENTTAVNNTTAAVNQTTAAVNNTTAAVNNNTDAVNRVNNSINTTHQVIRNSAGKLNETFKREGDRTRATLRRKP